MDTAARIRQGLSHRQTRFVFFLGIGGLLLLLGTLGVSAISFLSQIRVREETIRQDYVTRDRLLQSLRSQIYTSGTHVRDFLLDTDEALATEYRKQFLDSRLQIEDEIVAYRTLVPASDEPAFRQFSQELSSYMSAMAVVLNWSAAERHARASDFVQTEVLPRRMSTLGFADRIQQISERQSDESSQNVNGMLSSFRVKLLVLLLLTVGTGIALAVVALWRLLRLEKEAQTRFNEVASAREELERLSAELLSAQESERRRISRELHDEVGQVLTAIMLGLGNLRSAVKNGKTEEAFRQLQLVEDMTGRNADVVRNMSLLLRPTMLDDLGLVPALKWYAREVSRTGPMTVDVHAESLSEDLPEEYRTCVYRIVQEAVRNASRHSGAQHVRIQLDETRASDGQRILAVSVHDDGRGFDPSQEAGLGILGIRERMTQLAGKLEVDSKPGSGTTLRITLPLPNGTSGEAQEISPFRTA